MLDDDVVLALPEGEAHARRACALKRVPVGQRRDARAAVREDGVDLDEAAEAAAVDVRPGHRCVKETRS